MHSYVIQIHITIASLCKLHKGKIVIYVFIILSDSHARGPKLLSIKNYVNQLTDDELTTGYYQQDGATCHT